MMKSWGNKMAIYQNQILESSYLTAPNYVTYRSIMRVMFLESEQMNNHLYKEEIFQKLKEDSEFQDYSLEDMRQDLDQLVTWGNLIAIQDPGTVHTIAEYKNRQYRYSMSERAIEVERMTIRLENLEIETSSLSTGYFQRIEDALKNAEKVNSLSLQEINEWWHLLQDDFKNLDLNYKSYLREFYSADTMTLMKSVEFILHKDKLIQYLQTFIRQMQLKSKRIKNQILTIQVLFRTSLLNKIVKSEMAIPHLGNKIQNEQLLKETIQKKWMSFEKWFIAIDGHKAECERILDITNEIIRSVIENANMIVQLSNYGVSRKDDYKQFIQMFGNCNNIDDAHCLSAHVFGIQNIEHFRMYQSIDTEDIKKSAYIQECDVVQLQSHSRNYREKRQKQGVIRRTMDKIIALQEYEEAANKKKNQVYQYIKDNRLCIEEIHGVISSDLRISILQWISLANMSPSKTGNTEFGEKYILKRKEGNCVLHCEDGDITMPRYILEFEK